MAFESELFLLIEEKNYVEAIRLLKINPDLDINALDKEGCTFLTSTFGNYKNTKECHEFIEKILSNPKFEHANRPEGKAAASPLKMAMMHNSPDLLNLILQYKDTQNIQMIFERDKLWYELRTKRLQRIFKYIEEKNPSFSNADVLEEQQILEVFRELTIHHAFKTDDPSILQRVVDAGARLHLPFRDGTRPMDLIQDKKDTDVYVWMSAYMKSQDISATEKALKNLEQEHQQKQADIVSQHNEASKARVRALFQFSQPPEVSATPPVELSEAIERLKKSNESLNTKVSKFFSLQDSLNDLERRHKEQQEGVVTQQVAATKNTVRTTFKFYDSGEASNPSAKPSSKNDGPSVS